MSADEAPAIRRFQLGGGGDDSSSSSSGEDRKAGPATKKRAAAATAAPSTTTAAAPQSRPRPRIGSSSSLELSTSSAATSRSSNSPSRSAPSAGPRKAMAPAAATTTTTASSSGASAAAPAAAAAARPAPTTQLRQVKKTSSSSSSSSSSSDVVERTAVSRVARQTPATQPATDGVQRASAAAAEAAPKAATGSVAASSASPNASVAATSVSPPASVTSNFFFKRPNPSPLVAASLGVRRSSADTSAAIAQPAAAAAPAAAAPPTPPHTTTTPVRSGLPPASTAHTAPAPSVDKSAAPLAPPPPPPTPPSQPALRSPTAGAPAVAAVRAVRSAAPSSSSDDDATPVPALAPRRPSTFSSLSTASDGGQDGAPVVAAGKVSAIRKLTVPISVEGEGGAGTAADNEEADSAASPREPWQPSRSTFAVGSPAGSELTSVSSPTSRAAPASPPHPSAEPPKPVPAASLSAPRDGVGAALSGPGAFAYSRVSVQGRGSVPASVLAAPSGSKRRALPCEHRAPESLSRAPPPAAAATPSPALAAPSPVPDASSRQQASSTLPGPELAAQQPPSVASSTQELTRPHRHAPRLPGATHTSAGGVDLSIDREASPPQVLRPCPAREATAVSFIEDDAGSVAARRRGSSPSPVAATSPVDAGLAVSERAALSKDWMSDAGRAHAPSVLASPHPVLSRAAAAAAAQREWEEALTIYDDRVPPAERHSRRQALPVAGPSAPERGVDPVTACLLKGLRRGGRAAHNEHSPGRDPAAAVSASPSVEGRGGALLLVGHPVLRLGGTQLVLPSLDEPHSTGDPDNTDGEREVDDWPPGTSQPASSAASGRSPVVGRRYSGVPRTVQRLPATTQPQPLSQQPRQQPGTSSAPRRSAADPFEEHAVVLASAEWRTSRHSLAAREANAVSGGAGSGVAPSAQKATLPPAPSSSRPTVSAPRTSARSEGVLGVDLLNYRGSQGRPQRR